MKKVFLSCLIFLSVIILSACGKDNITNQNETADQNANQNTNANVNESGNEADSAADGIIFEKVKGEPVLSFGYGPEIKILSEKKENNITTLETETIIDNKKVICSEQREQKGTDELTIKKNCNNGEKSVTVIKLINNKRYLRTYTIFPDGRKDKNEFIVKFEK